MIEVNGATIPAERIDRELFWHEKGSFTGANRQRIIKFEQAHGGALFLNVIGDRSLSAQDKVLRVLEENQLIRVGGERIINLDVWGIAPTNKDFQVATEKGEFSEDLYYRPSVILARMPPVREHERDVPILLDYFVFQRSKRRGTRLVTRTRSGKYLSSSPRKGLSEKSVTRTHDSQ